MPLSAGQSLSFYEILGPLGAGGMGEVYRARDTRLEREVAIKVLPVELAGDEERLRRFEREARTLASLNHPNVGGIHGVDQQGDVCFLALELVPGEDLATRLARGPLPVDEAIDVCGQIAEGLEAAHEAGVVHRDLKPANVRVTPEGVVKLLDFGLAKPLLPGAGGDGATSAASDSFLVTEEGLVLGTPTYMSPEQARGRPVDRRTDIWAFGCVLYECLTGERAFHGGSLTDVLAAIVGEEPDLSRLPPLPAEVRALLLRCLRKDPRTRLRDIGEARVLLRSGDVGTGAIEPADARPGPAPSRPSRGALFVVGGVVLGAALGVVAGGLLGDDDHAGDATTAAPTTAAATPRVRRFAQPPGLDDDGQTIRWKETYLSPDGDSLAVTTSEGLVVRSLDSLESTLLPGTESLGSAASQGDVAWSPDSAHLAYIDGHTIVRVTPEGRHPVTLTSMSDDGVRLRMLAWLDDGRIVFGSMGDGGVRLHAIPEGGGPATELAVVGETVTAGHLHGISPAPGGRFVSVMHSFFGDTFTVLTEGDDGMRELFSLPGESIPTARWVPGDHLLFRRGASEDADELWAVPLSRDPFEVVGEPFFVLRGVSGESVSQDGTMAYVEHRSAEHQLAWWSAEGGVEPIGRVHDRPIGEVFREGDGILYTVGTSLPMDLWRHDLRRSLSTQVATGPRGALWGATLPDGRLTFSMLDTQASGPTLRSFLLPATGLGQPEPWLEGGVMRVVGDLALIGDFQADSMDLYVHDLATDERRPFRVDDTMLSAATISPDGAWAVYRSDGDLFLTRFPDGEGAWQVSPDGGRDPSFTSDGSAIYFVSDRTLHRVSLRTTPEVELGTPEPLGRPGEGTSLQGVVDEETGRFLATHTEGSTAGDLVVVLDWASELGGR